MPRVRSGAAPGGECGSALLAHECKAAEHGYVRIAGVDEAGRGPLAGPVVAAAVILPRHADLPPVKDSKQLTPAQRETLASRLETLPGIAIGLAWVDAAEIDRVNILRATHSAMRSALNQLRPPADFALVDGLPVPDLPVPSEAIVKGDALSASIAAASILAKVARDRYMVEADRRHPGYGFARHKGYGTAAHLAALRTLGPCPEHRRSFAPVTAAAGEPSCQPELNLT